MLTQALAVTALLGLAQAWASWIMAQHFFARAPLASCELPPITILKPLHGDEPLLEAALASLCGQDYPTFQIIFGVQNPADSALAVFDRLRRRFPSVDMTIVINPAPHGANRKVANLINMFPSARHDILVIADSDVHVGPTYLRDLCATLAQPSVGLATCLYVGLAAHSAFPARLGASAINHFFLPSALLARTLGRQDCLGATMALRRETLARIGGLEALSNHLADDNMLGELVRAQGLTVALAPAVVATTVAEKCLGDLWRHELRWARTIRALEPIGFAASVLQYKLVWAALALAVAPSVGTLTFFAALWAAGALIARGVERSLAPHVKGLAFTAPVWLLPLREALSVAVLIASYADNRVEWRGHHLIAARPLPKGTMQS